jgi:hypothetical protein
MGFAALTKRWSYADPQKETGSDAEVGKSFDADYTGVMYSDHTGHGLSTGTTAVKFYQTNSARDNGADIEPVPITPVRGQNWPGMQIQLRNGWGSLSFGKRLAYDDYLRLLTDSATKNRHYLIPSPSSTGITPVRGGPSPSNVQKLIAGTSGAQPQSPAGPGFLAVNLTGRTYYG